MPKSKLLRVVRTNQKLLVVDTTGRAPGRGAYLCQKPECWDRALGKGGLGRSLGMESSSMDLAQVRDYYQEHIAPKKAAQ